jgi:hypothetical protein
MAFSESFFEVTGLLADEGVEPRIRLPKTQDARTSSHHQESLVVLRSSKRAQAVNDGHDRLPAWAALVA